MQKDRGDSWTNIRRQLDNLEYTTNVSRSLGSLKEVPGEEKEREEAEEEAEVKEREEAEVEAEIDDDYSSVVSSSSSSPSSSIPLPSDSRSFLYITSDHPFASLVTRDGTLPAHYMISTESCHIDYNKTAACNYVTIKDFFLMSLSHSIIAGAWDQPSGPHYMSSFSRYAALYGLRTYCLYSSTMCWYKEDMQNIFKRQQGNWMC